MDWAEFLMMLVSNNCHTAPTFCRTTTAFEKEVSRNSEDCRFLILLLFPSQSHWRTGIIHDKPQSLSQGHNALAGTFSILQNYFLVHRIPFPSTPLSWDPTAADEAGNSALLLCWEERGMWWGREGKCCLPPALLPLEWRCHMGHRYSPGGRRGKNEGQGTARPRQTTTAPNEAWH